MLAIETLALFSDVHGNRSALEAVLEDLEAREISTAYCLGDLVGYGPDPNGVIDLLRSRGTESILGNYDEGVGWETGDCGCFYADPEAEQIGKASYAFTVATVTAENKAHLRTLPRELHANWPARRFTWCTAVPVASTSICSATGMSGPMCGWPKPSQMMSLLLATPMTRGSAGTRANCS